MPNDQPPESLPAVEAETPPPSPDAPLTLPPRRGRGRPKGSKNRSAEAGEDGTFSADDDEKPVARRVRRVKVSKILAPADLERLRVELAGNVALTGMLLGAVAPVTGLTIMYRAEVMSSALVDIAESSPRVMQALVALSRASKYAALGQVGAAITVAVMVDMGMMGPDAQPAQLLVGEAVATLREQAAQAEQAATPDKPVRVK